MSSKDEKIRLGQQRALDTLDSAARRFKLYNHYLAESARLLKTKGVQPKTHGSITLELVDCGSDCMGCPHPKWKRWINRKKQKQSNPVTWFAASIAFPRKFKTSEKAEKIIDYAVYIIQERAELIKTLRQIEYKNKAFREE